VDGPRPGSAVDPADPTANPLPGVRALLAAHLSSRGSGALRLQLVLAAAFDLFWFGSQPAFKTATRTNHWAWPLKHLHIAQPPRYAMVLAGALVSRAA
jgi:hypothetical protein